jgi:hypothetical protein
LKLRVSNFQLEVLVFDREYLKKEGKGNITLHKVPCSSQHEGETEGREGRCLLAAGESTTLCIVLDFKLCWLWLGYEESKNF